MKRTIILVHGRSHKPPQIALERQWKEALHAGFCRDFPAQANLLTDPKETVTSFVYYGDKSNEFLSSHERGTPYDPVADTRERDAMLQKLSTYKKAQFNKSVYNKLPGKSSFGEAAADALGGILGFMRVSDPLIAQVAPDMRHYWDEDSSFGTDVRYPMIKPLREAMERQRKAHDAGKGHPIMVIAHSLGTMISYDTFWKFSHTGEYRDDYPGKISLWITLGSPLADETVKRNLKGAGFDSARRYPNNVERWLNVAAEDDYISHDSFVKDDFRSMENDFKLINSIEDHHIYNLAVRKKLDGKDKGKSNPHSDLGYLIHPVVTEAVAKWFSKT